jgi:DNA-binding IclR family transcriptional regulator
MQTQTLGYLTRLVISPKIIETLFLYSDNNVTVIYVDKLGRLGEKDNQLNINDSTDTILAVERAIIILQNLAATKDEKGVRNISRELGYSPAVTQKILNTLRVHGFVQQSEDTQRYRLGLGSLNVGLAVLAQTDVVKVARPYMEELTADTGETTFLAIRDIYRAVYIEIVKSPHPIRMGAEIGAHRPLNCTSVGKILLAWAPSGILSNAEKAGALEKSTKNSIIEIDSLEAELIKVREQGYAVDNEEYYSEALCVAGPIFGPDGKILAAITTSGPSFRMKDKISGFSSLVKTSAAEISLKLGHGLNLSTEVEAKA